MSAATRRPCGEICSALLRKNLIVCPSSSACGIPSDMDYEFKSLT